MGSVPANNVACHNDSHGKLYINPQQMNSKAYVVAGPVLTNAVNRHSKALAFTPSVAQLGKRITGHDEATNHVVNHNPERSEFEGEAKQLCHHQLPERASQHPVPIPMQNPIF